jgi:hypothetical protein
MTKQHNPKLVGRAASSLGASVVEQNLSRIPGHVRVTYAQAAMLRQVHPETAVLASLDTTDKGSRGSYAKRWYAWFVPKEYAKGTGALDKRAARVNPLLANPAKVGVSRRRNHWLLPMAVGAGAMHLAHRAKLNPLLANPAPGQHQWSSPKGYATCTACGIKRRLEQKGSGWRPEYGTPGAGPRGGTAWERSAPTCAPSTVPAARAARANPARSRWGYTFKKGDVVQDHRGVTYRYVKLAKANDFSRAYGRQAIVSLGAGPIDLDETMKIGLDDLGPKGA